MNFEQEAPGPLLQTSEELINALHRLKQVEDQYHEKYQQFYERYCYLEDGHATDRVVEKVFTKKEQ